jgi:SAM-dependent methyltransferase
MNQKVPNEGVLNAKLESFFRTSDSRWVNLFRDSMGSVDTIRRQHARKLHARFPLISHVEQYTPPGGSILETGAGTGALSLHLSQQGYQSSTLEKDPDMVRLSELLQEVIGGHSSRYQGCMTHLPFAEKSFDTVFNHGVLEYFDEDAVIDVIREQLRVASYFVFAIPTNLNHASYIEDCENLWSYAKWKKLIRESGATLVESFSFFSYRRFREALNRLLGMKLQRISPGAGFILK